MVLVLLVYGLISLVCLRFVLVVGLVVYGVDALGCW